MSMSTTLADILGGTVPVAEGAADRFTTHLSDRKPIAATILLDLLRVWDFCVFLVAGCLALRLVDHLQVGSIPAAGILSIAIVAGLTAFYLNSIGGYLPARASSLSFQFRAVFVALLLGAAATFVIVSVVEDGRGAAGRVAAAWFASAGLMLGLTRVVVLRIACLLRDRGLLGRRIAVLGTPEQAVSFIRHLQPEVTQWVQIVGLYNDTPHDALAFPNLPYRGTLSDLVADGQVRHLDAIVIAVPDASAHVLDDVAETLSGLATDLYLCPDLPKLRRPVTDFGGLSMDVLSRRPLSERQLFAKAIFDLFVSAILLVLISPLMVLLAILVRLDSPGPSLFRQTRIGLNNVPFTCLKYRTMYHHAADALADKQTTWNDVRVTRFGRLLRRSSLDELPQLINVLRGDMSLVGPRPHAPNTRADGRFFAEVVDAYAARHRVKPGITGWAQVKGWRGETATVDQIEQRVRHDIHYIQNWSLSFDVQILFRTLLTGFFGSRTY